MALHIRSTAERRSWVVVFESTIIVENKVMYGAEYHPILDGRFEIFSVESSVSSFPTLTFSPVGFARADVTVVTYGGSVGLALEVAERLLIEREIILEVVALSRLAPVPVDDLRPSVERSGRVVTLEEGTLRMGIGAEISSLISERLWESLRGPIKRVAAADYIIPNARPLEDYVLPSSADLERAVIGVLNPATRDTSTIK